MTEIMDSLAQLDEQEDEDGPVIETTKTGQTPKKRRQPAWNALRRKQPVEAARVVRQPVIDQRFVKPLKPIGGRR